MSTNPLSRRQMFVRSAATAAAVGLSIAMTAAAKKAKAKVDPEPDPAKDNDTLNALLAAEYDAIATYTAGAGLIDADATTEADVKALVTSVAVHFRSQHMAHAAALKALIEENDGTPVEDDEMAKLPSSFPTTPNVFDVLKLATDKEKAAAFTYAQVMEGITTQTAAKLIASIGAVETQHFVVLHLLVDGLVSPTEFTAMNPTLVVPAAFILDVGGEGGNLETFAALDDLLAFDAA